MDDVPKQFTASLKLVNRRPSLTRCASPGDVRTAEGGGHSFRLVTSVSKNVCDQPSSSCDADTLRTLSEQIPQASLAPSDTSGCDRTQLLFLCPRRSRFEAAKYRPCPVDIYVRLCHASAELFTSLEDRDRQPALDNRQHSPFHSANFAENDRTTIWILSTSRLDQR
jgi:hypothetical protein